MTGECLDRFYDDVEAVVTDLLTHASMPIRNIEAWIASRLNAATVDAHRRRRGQVGALQRPRLPRWLAGALGDDPWLVDLAVQMLQWVGVRTTAGTGLWPLDAWALRRAAVTRDPVTSDAARVARDVESVLAAMRERPDWYLNYVERPLGHKQAPVTTVDTAGESPLLLADRAEVEESHLLDLADQALRTLEKRFTANQNPTTTVREVLRTVFVAENASRELDRPPHDAPDYEQHLVNLLEDSGRIDVVVAVVRQALREERADGMKTDLT